MTCDNSIVSLYLREEGQADYVLQDYCPVAGGTSFDLWEKPWMVGRGMYNNEAAAWFNGLIDEVRISNVALDPSEFLQAPGAHPVEVAVNRLERTNKEAPEQTPGEHIDDNHETHDV